MTTAAHLISALTHPLFMLTIGLGLVMAANPYAFGFRELEQGWQITLLCFIYTFLFPAITLLIMRGLGMVNSLSLESKEERWGPLIATLAFYFWFFANIRQNPNVPDPFESFTLGACIALSLAFMVTLFEKVSLHAVGVGGLVGLVGILGWVYDEPIFTIGPVRVHAFVALATLLILSGVIGSARLHLKAHDTRDIIAGFLIGLASQFFAVRILY